MFIPAGMFNWFRNCVIASVRDMPGLAAIFCCNNVDMGLMKVLLTAPDMADAGIVNM